MGRLLVLLLTCFLVVSYAQTPTAQTTVQGTGTIKGVVTDPDGGLLPGVTVTAMNPTTMRSTVSNLSGEFVIAGVPPGCYLIEAALLGFRTTTRDAVEVVSSQTTQSDFVMRLGIITTVDLRETFGPSRLAAQSAFVGHVRIRAPLRQGEVFSSPSTQWVADALSVAKGTPYVGSDRSIRFWQTMAGRIYVDGRTYVGESPLHTPGQEFIAFLNVGPGSELTEHSYYMTPVSGGIANWKHEEREGVLREMPVQQFLDAIRRLLR